MVDSGTINTFKSRLDKHWLDQDVVYNFNSELTGTGRCFNLYVMLFRYARLFAYDWNVLVVYDDCEKFWLILYKDADTKTAQLRA